MFDDIYIHIHRYRSLCHDAGRYDSIKERRAKKEERREKRKREERREKRQERRDKRQERREMIFETTRNENRKGNSNTLCKTCETLIY